MVILVLSMKTICPKHTIFVRIITLCDCTKLLYKCCSYTGVWSTKLVMIKFLFEHSISVENHSKYGCHLCGVFSLLTVPVAPSDLTAIIVSNRTLDVTWTYPSSLIEQITSFEVRLFAYLPVS